MSVHLTRNAHENLGVLFDYHVDYNLAYAEKFYDDITEFIRQMLSEFPNIGTVYNPEKHLRRLVFNKRYNIYYLDKDDVVYVLYIIDASLYLNEELQKSDIVLPELR